MKRIVPFIYTWLAIALFFFLQSCRKEDGFEQYRISSIIMDSGRCFYTAQKVEYAAKPKQTSFYAACGKYKPNQYIYIKP